MSYFIGIDLGTSSVKLLLVDEAGQILRSESRSYPLAFPAPGWSEQNPDDWWTAVCGGLSALLAGIPAEEIRGLGCGGQMHGLVALDAQGAVIRPAILWNDGRTAAETAELNQNPGKEKLSEYCANIAFAGFTAPKLLWMQKHEPESFARIAMIMLPKDYINYRLTGVFSTDFSDASGTLLLDVQNRCWSKEMLVRCGLREDQLPPLFESYETVGFVQEGLPLPAGIRVVAGAGDNAAAAVGTGTVGEGACNLSLGTSGTLFISSDHFSVDPHNALHAFAHADGRYHLMGCMLSAASCCKWLLEEILGTKDYDAEYSAIRTDDFGRNPLYFLPYLMGERSPINDSDARGLFIGLSLDTTRAQLVQAVLEGVGFALRDSLEVARSLGLDIRRSKLCGGGAKSPLWAQMLADILNLELEIPQTEEGPGYGGAMLAMVGAGLFPDVRAAAAALTCVKARFSPEPEAVARYEARYDKFKKIYPSVSALYQNLKETNV